ncbi:MAG: hypothetical protein C0402_03715 [Thermodesulfovibrio sp.]|nr:hypothetical protein [Thermodesulfovibrio sp.]
MALPEGVKVEYKDFKGAELLDIQMVGKRPPVPEKEHPVPLQKKILRPPGPAPSDRKKPYASNTFLIVLAVAVTALACYLLLRIFLMQ